MRKVGGALAFLVVLALVIGGLGSVAIFVLLWVYR